PAFVTTFCALLPWQLFETALSQTGNSLVGSQNLITKVYFPRLSIPVSSLISGLVDFAVGFVLLLILIVWYRVVLHHAFHPGWAVLAFPLFVVMALALALGVGLWLSALNVQYRDVRYVIPFITQLWFFVTPVVYPASMIGEKLGPKWQTIYGLNPMAGVV